MHIIILQRVCVGMVFLLVFDSVTSVTLYGLSNGITFMFVALLDHLLWMLV